MAGANQTQTDRKSNERFTLPTNRKSMLSAARFESGNTTSS